MNDVSLQQLFTPETLDRLLPASRGDDFFEALFGDATEGAYDIRLAFQGLEPGDNSLRFTLELHQRPGKCLACNLTYGLPEVFSRHPGLNIAGVVKEIDSLLGDRDTCADWRLGPTHQTSKSLHTIPLIITLG